MNVQVSASTGEKYVQYLFGTGTNGALSGGNAKVYLGYPASEDWVRFERNVEADFEAYAGGGATWTNTDGLYIYWPKDLVSDSFFVDDIRLSDSLTVEHNTLGPGVIGHILRNRSIDPGTMAVTDAWFHYDQVGTVISTTDGDGDASEMFWLDAFGNRLEDWETGLVVAGGGWGLHTKYSDAAASLTYMHQRWYAADLGVFGSKSPLSPWAENSFSFVFQLPTSFVDPTGLVPKRNFGITDHDFWKWWHSHGKDEEGLRPNDNFSCNADAQGKFQEWVDRGRPLGASKGIGKNARRTAGKLARKGLIGLAALTPDISDAMTACFMAGSYAGEQVDRHVVTPTVERAKGPNRPTATQWSQSWGDAVYDLIPFE